MPCHFHGSLDARCLLMQMTSRSAPHGERELMQQLQRAGQKHELKRLHALHVSLVTSAYGLGEDPVMRVPAANQEKERVPVGYSKRRRTAQLSMRDGRVERESSGCMMRCHCWALFQGVWISWGKEPCGSSSAWLLACPEPDQRPHPVLIRSPQALRRECATVFRTEVV